MVDRTVKTSSLGMSRIHATANPGLVNLAVELQAVLEFPGSSSSRETPWVVSEAGGEE